MSILPENQEQSERDEKISAFLAHLATDKAASEYTSRNYEQALREFTVWHKNERKSAPNWITLERDDFRFYLRFLGREQVGRAAIRLRFSALRSFYKFLIRRGFLTASPIKNILLPKLEKRLPRFLTAQQMNDLLEAPLREFAEIKKRSEADENSAPADPLPYLRDTAILETIYSCGLRISELCGMTVEDLTTERGLVRVRGKGKKERIVPIGVPALHAIESYWKALWCEPEKLGPAFLSSRHDPSPVSARYVQAKLKQYLIRAELDPELTPHKLRHSYATHMLDRGADLRSVQELLGHAHLVTTEVYTHVTTERLKRAYEKAHPRA
jgi:integrase/recombinase XerC